AQEGRALWLEHCEAPESDLSLAQLRQHTARGRPGLEEWTTPPSTPPSHVPLSDTAAALPLADDDFVLGDTDTDNEHVLSSTVVDDTTGSGTVSHDDAATNRLARWASDSDNDDDSWD
ncbi:MAG: hypothetical protein MHM6MM_008524, partial [Cercozoa sp. M6MM]